MPAGYVFIDRENSKDLAVMYADEETAIAAVTDDMFIDSLCEEDAIDCYFSAEPPKLEERNLILRSEVEFVYLGDDV